MRSLRAKMASLMSAMVVMVALIDASNVCCLVESELTDEELAEQAPNEPL